MATSSKTGILGVLAAALLTALLSASPALAAEQAWWTLSSSARPTDLQLQPGQKTTIVAQATNLGDAAVNGSESPVTITDKLPPGLTATAVSGISGTNHGFSSVGAVTCSTREAGSEVSCTWAGPETLQPYERLEVLITAEVQAGAQSGAKYENEVAVSGGQSYRCNQVEGGGRFTSAFCKVGGGFEEKREEAEPAGSGDFEGEFAGAVPGLSLKRPVILAGGPTPFGVEDYDLALESGGGSPETQAGAHPFQFTTTLGLNQTASPSKPPALAKDLSFDLPPGLIGNPTVIPQCTEAEFSTLVGRNADLCPSDSAVGVATVTIEFTVTPKFNNETVTYTVPVFNLVPAPGEPARFGFEVEKVPVLIDTSVRTGSDYGIVASVHNITQISNFLSEHVTLWGVPGDPEHDHSRGWSCIAGGAWNVPPCVLAKATQPPPFLTLPSSCTGPLQSSVQADSWTDPTSLEPVSASTPTGLNGCNGLPFSAGIIVAPGVQEASTPTGLKVDVHVPQEATLNPSGVAGSDVKDIAVTLPEGVTLNPAGADGLEACSEGQVGFEADRGTDGFEEFNPVSEPGVKTALFNPTVPEPLSPGLNLGAEGFCPNASKVGTAKITLPILAHPLEGSVYLASQNENPFGSLLAMYIVAEDPVSGVLVKLPGDVSLNPATGQITATFENTPQAPFEDAEVNFFGGERAPLATPAQCGSYTTSATLTPWSGNAPVNTQSSFEITTGPNHSACPSQLPFAPSLTAQSSNIQAGGFTPFTTTISREDGQQNIDSVTLHTPAGLLGILTGVPLCAEAQANAGTCPQSSLIGHTIVSVGLGGDPYTVTGGEVFLTEKYDGAPFGLSIVNPAIAGPFNLGKVVVRARIEVDPHTAALTITTGEIPHILDGIPLQIKHINVTIDRNGFIFNPTTCDPTSITGNVGSVEGASSPVSTPFQVTNCERLAFKPKFTAATSGKTSKADGASLTVKLSYPKAPQGTEANIAKVKVDLPKQLPSRLTTLQKACLAKVFEANPANCPKDSEVGHAKAITPILPVPLEGPAYFVSHGGEAFPSLIVVLKGYGVTVDLVGTTFISKAGITSSTFKSVPDVPVGSFELTLPEGPFSALGTNKNLCTQKLAMPTAFVAQNGAEIHESTPVSVTGCKKAKKSTKKKGKHKAGKGKQGKK